MDKKDLKAIQGLLRKELKSELSPIKSRLDKVEGKLNKNTASVMKIERNIGTALELRKDASELRKTKFS